MTLANLMRYSLLLMVGSCTALVIYVGNNADSVMRTLITRLLHEYGVTDVRPVNIQWQKNQLTLDSVWLTGRQNDVGYTLFLADINIAYQWRELFEQKLQAVRVKSFDITISDMRTETSSVSGTNLDITEFSPPKIFSALPIATLEIDTWRVRYKRNEAPTFSSAGSLHFDKRLRMSVQTVLAGANITGLITTDKDEKILADINIAGENEEIAAVRINLDSRNDPWRWAFEGDWQQDALLSWLHSLHLDFNTPLVPFSSAGSGAGRGSFSGLIEHPEIIKLDSVEPNIAATGIEASLELSADIESIAYPTVFNDLSGEAEGTIALHRGQFLAALFISDTVFKGVNSDYSFELTSVQIDSEIDVLPALAVHSDANGELLVQRDDKRSPVVDFSFVQSGSLDDMTYKVGATLAESALTLGINGEFDLETGEGGHKLALHSGNLSRLNAQALPTIRDWFSLSSIPDIHSGELQLDTTLQTYDYDATKWAQTSRLRIKDLSFTYDGYSVEQVALATKWTGLSEWQTLQPLQINIGKVDAGFPVYSVRMTAAIEDLTPLLTPELNIMAFSANVFGGQVFLEKPTIWNPSAHSNGANVRFEDWELAEIVALQQNQDIAAQGTIQGSLPIAFSAGRVAISKGYLSALPPGGTIRYSSSDATRNLGNNDQLALALNLLSDFRYETLKSEVDLDAQGNLVLDLSLGGRNPSEYGGQEVRFNIRVEQNLDPLLQSLRLSDTLTRSIENQVR